MHLGIQVGVTDCGAAIFGPLENKLAGEMGLQSEKEHTDTRQTPSDP